MRIRGSPPLPTFAGGVNGAVSGASLAGERGGARPKTLGRAGALPTLGVPIDVGVLSPDDQLLRSPSLVGVPPALSIDGSRLKKLLYAPCPPESESGDGLPRLATSAEPRHLVSLGLDSGDGRDVGILLPNWVSSPPRPRIAHGRGMPRGAEARERPTSLTGFALAPAVGVTAVIATAREF